MKTTLLFFLLSASLCLAKEGEILWQGKYYRLRDFRLKDAETITVGGQAIAFDKAPAVVKQALADDRANARQRNNEEAKRAAVSESRKRTGSFPLSGSVVSVTPEGSLVMHEDTLQIFYVRGELGRATGEKVSLEAVPDGTFRYTTALGADSTVRAVKVVPSPWKQFEKKAE